MTIGPDSLFGRVIAELKDDLAHERDQARLMAGLRVARRKVALLVAVADVTGHWTLDRVTHALSDFMDAAISAALCHLMRESAEKGEGSSHRWPPRRASITQGPPRLTIRPSIVLASCVALLACALAGAAEPTPPPAGAAEDPSSAPDAPEAPEAKEPAAPEGGLLPFVPEWVPLGPAWVKEGGDAAHKRPPTDVPATMLREAPAGSTPDPELPLAELDTWSLIPIPIVYADPNLGFGIGLMPVVLLHPKERIEWIIAPSADYNDLLGVSLTNRIYYYPTIQEELFIYNDISTEGNMEHEARFHGRDRFVKGSDFHAAGYFVKDPTRRFFGLGADTREGDETDYQMRESAVEADVGYFFTEDLRLGATMRYRHSRVSGGIVDKQPDTTDVFSGLGGVKDDLTTVLAYGGRATIDLRDDSIFPSKGLLLDGFFEVSAKGLISSTAFVRWGVSATGFYPIGVGGVPDAIVAVARVSYQEIRGDDRLPFWEMPSLGGRSKLRGFGVGRFTDEAYLLASLEARTRVAEFTIMQNRLRLELTAFLDSGRVFGDGTGLTDSAWQYVPGFGVRVLVPDSGIIARGDVGFGGEGPAIFLVLGYPF